MEQPNDLKKASNLSLLQWVQIVVHPYPTINCLEDQDFLFTLPWVVRQITAWGKHLFLHGTLVLANGDGNIILVFFHKSHISPWAASFQPTIKRGWRPEFVGWNWGARHPASQNDLVRLKEVETTGTWVIVSCFISSMVSRKVQLPKKLWKISWADLAHAVVALLWVWRNLACFQCAMAARQLMHL